MRCTILLLFILAVPSMAFPAVIYVPDDYAKIQDAISSAVNGDTILVRPGTYVTPAYAEKINFLGKQIEVRSDVDGDPATCDLSPQTTVIDGNQLGAAVCFQGGEGPSTVLAGFTITNGLVSGWYGGGIYCFKSSPTIKNNIITGNQAIYGGGMSNEYAFPTVSCCIFSGNSAVDSGGGVFNVFSSPTMTNCTFSGNSATNYGGGMYNYQDSSTLTNCTFSGNSADRGGGLNIRSSSDTIITNCIFSANSAINHGGGLYMLESHDSIITNCTFSENTVGYLGSGICNVKSTAIVTNCILWNDGSSEIYNSSGTTDVTFSCIQGGYSGTGNIDADPLFLDPLIGDFRLQQDPCEPGIINPCVDTADPASPMIDGSTRSDSVQDAGIVDMGYHYPNDGFLEVPKEYATIQAAIDAALNKQTVLVAPGTYEECIDFQGKSIEVRSDVDGDPATCDLSPQTTVIDGNQLGAVVCFQGGEGSSSVLAGFTITNGLVSGWNGGGIYCFNSSPTIKNNIITGNQALCGGGMSNKYASPTVSCCIFSGNSAVDSGGGVYNVSSSPTMTNCTFSGNSATNYGGGMCNYQDSSTLTNCTFSGNSANRGGGLNIISSSDTIFTNCIFSANSAINHGGGLYMLESHDSIITNCTFSENTVGYLGSGICNVKSTAIVTNCILWNNGSSEIYNSSGTTDVTFSCIQGGYSGTGNIDADPLFLDPLIGDFHLTYSSPCKDTGDNSVPDLPTKDFEGDHRIAYVTVDMGADEFYTHLYWTGDATPGGNGVLKFIGIPGTAPVQLFLGSGVMDPPMTTAYGDWCLQFPLFFQVQLGSMPSSGVLLLPFTLPPDTPAPLTLPFQGGIGMELTNLRVMVVE